MSLTDIQQRLSTHHGFVKAITTKSSLTFWGWTAIIAGVAGIAYNLYFLFSHFGAQFGAVFGNFFAPLSLLKTGSSVGFADYVRYVYVWAPLVLIPLGIVLLLIREFQKRHAGVGHYKAYAHGGWPGRLRYTALHIPNAGPIVPVAFVSHPGVADADFENAVSQFSTKVDAMAESDRKALAQAADKAGVLKGAIPAQTVDADAPNGLIAVANVAPSEWVAVVPPINGHGRTAVLPLRRP